jgi:hypothetical protein
VLKNNTLEYSKVQNTGALRPEKQVGMKISKEREYKEITVCGETCQQQLEYQTLQSNG